MKLVAVLLITLAIAGVALSTPAEPKSAQTVQVESNYVQMGLLNGKACYECSPPCYVPGQGCCDNTGYPQCCQVNGVCGCCRG